MIHFSRLGALSVIAGGVLSISSAYGITGLLPAAGPPDKATVNASQGYLGVVIHDLDNDRANELKLKDQHGAEILKIDQDAPAAKAGLKVHDVVVQMNGQRVEGIEQLRRMLRETPPGRTASFVAMRDGQPMNITVQLADRIAIASQALGVLTQDPDYTAPETPSSPVSVPPAGKASKRSSRSSSFLEPFGRNRYYVGVEVQPLTTQLAEYFGVRNGAGVLVGSVFPNSPGAVAGIKVADIIQRVNGQPIVTLSDWEHAIRANHGKQVELTLIRDKKEQRLNMVAGPTKNGSQLNAPELGSPQRQMLAELRGNFFEGPAFADQALHLQPVPNIGSKRLQKAVEPSCPQMEDGLRQIERQGQELRIEQMD